MTSFVWTIILSLMQGQFDDAKEGGFQQQDDARKSAHYAAMQIHTGIPVSLLVGPQENQHQIMDLRDVHEFM